MPPAMQALWSRMDIDVKRFARLYPLTAKLGRSRPWASELQRQAIDIEEVWPAETAELPPVTMLEGDWDRITAVQEETSWEAERLRSAGGLHEHQATMRYTLSNVLATPWGFYTSDQAFYRSGKVNLAQLLGMPVVHHEKGYFGTPVIGMKYFGHWLRDGLPCSLLRRPGEALYFPVNPSWHHAQQYCALLGVDRLAAPLVFFDEMSVCTDFGQNQHRQGRMRQIQKALHAKLPTGTARGVFIKRGKTGAARVLLNEDEVADALAAQGFNICTAADDLQTILEACAHVEIVVTVEGSHWAHAFFAARQGATHVTLNPSDRFNNQYAAYMPALEQRLATLVMTRQDNGYVADIARLNGLLEHLRAQA